MIKMVLVLRRRPGMTHTECVDHHRDVHGEIMRAKKVTVRKYVQDHVFDAAYGATGDIEYQVTLPRDSVAENYFDDLDSLLAHPRDPYFQEVVAPDGPKFGDLTSPLGMIVEETRTEVPYPGPGAVKVLHFLKAAEGISPEEFQRRREEAHEDLLADMSGPARYLRGHEWNIPIADNDAPRPNAPGQPQYEGYAALWFDEADALTGFRAYEEALAAYAEKHGAFYQPSLSFFLLTREKIIFDDLNALPDGDSTA